MLFDGGEVEVCKGASAIVSHLQQVHKSLRQNPEKVRLLDSVVCWSSNSVY